MRFNISWLIKSNFKWLYQIIGKVHWCIIFCSFTMELYLSIKRIIWTVVIFFIFRSFSIQLKLNRWRDGCESNKKEKTQSLSTESIPHVFTQSHVCHNLRQFSLHLTHGLAPRQHQRKRKEQEQNVWIWTKNTTRIHSG